MPEASAIFLEAIDLGIEGLGGTLTERHGRDRPVIRACSHACCWAALADGNSLALDRHVRLLPIAGRD
ncbi:hypothetical protein QO239_09855 [Cupriavidus taiwanensis]|uniref:hypothetical protein n=1 Tax=Cupriavidus taiwanensis TaxID=164546 RepID=UPI0025400C2D|nr:hypothetical protein [Cupriavidus taiwanensis]MDK3022894.1 hypothetical protein [Cupriavidus taiwanensis]